MDVNHNVTNQLAKTAELLISIIRTRGEQPTELVEVIDLQAATIYELRRELQMVKNELGSKENKATMQAAFGGTNVLHKEDGTVKVF